MTQETMMILERLSEIDRKIEKINKILENDKSKNESCECRNDIGPHKKRISRELK